MSGMTSTGICGGTITAGNRIVIDSGGRHSPYYFFGLLLPCVGWQGGGGCVAGLLCERLQAVCCGDLGRQVFRLLIGGGKAGAAACGVWDVMPAD
jgi:hypothetical protein